MQKVELLAPAGNYETMVGAFNAGADAVYLGGQGFGARAFADNFTNEEVVQAIRYAHLIGKKIYLTTNTLLKENEIPAFCEFFAPFADAGLDAAIIQDMGVFRIIKEYFPWVELHVSTQMTITGPSGAYMMKELGASRVVPARELTLKEIANIHKYCLSKDGKGIEIEAFIHGAMCYCYSGACLFSSMIGERSGNRGRCAQPCRLPYKLNGHGKECYPLSLKDMCMVDRIPQLIEAGIDSFKIEGRMKKPEYAAGVTSIYRKYIDKYYELIAKGERPEDIVLSEADVDIEKKTVFSTSNINSGKTVQSSAESASNSGIILTATEKEKERLRGLYLRSKIGEGYYFRHNGSDMVTIDNPSYNGSDENVLAEVREKYLSGEKKIPIDLYCKLRTSEKAEIELRIAELSDKNSLSGSNSNSGANTVNAYNSINVIDGLSVKVFGDEVAASVNRPTSSEDCEKQLKKFGNTSFELKSIKLDIGDSIFMPVKVLNDLRRTAASRLDEEILKARGYVDHESKEFSVLPETKYDPSKINVPIKKKLFVSVMTSQQLSAVLEESAKRGNIDRIYVDSRILLKQKDLPEFGKAECFIALPYVTRSEEGIPDRFDLKNILDIATEKGYSGILVRNLEQLAFAIEYGYKGSIIPDYGLYLWNHRAFAEYYEILEQQGFEEFNLPLELDFAEMNRTMNGIYSAILSSKRRDQLKLPLAGMQIYGRVPMMHSANCIRNTFKDCTGKRGQMVSYDTIYINDRTGRTMPVTYDCRYCTNIIWNSVPVSLFKKMNRINDFATKYNLGLRIDFTTEKSAQIADILRGYEELIFENSGSDKNLFADKLSGMEYTTGHFERNVD